MGYPEFVDEDANTDSDSRKCTPPVPKQRQFGKMDEIGFSCLTSVRFLSPPFSSQVRNPKLNFLIYKTGKKNVPRDIMGCRDIILTVRSYSTNVEILFLATD